MLNASRSAGSIDARRLFKVVGCILVFAQPAQSTVLEYDTNGDVTVTKTSPKIAKAKKETTVPSKAAMIRKLTRETAVRYSGSKGVRKAGLDALTFVDVFESLIERESEFDPDAESAKGARGLGQLMPETARNMGVNDPYEPRLNLIGSAKYFTLLLDRFGSLELALAAYNAGPERVEQYKGVPPFEETKTYISWILNKAGIRSETPRLTEASTRKLLERQSEEPLKGDLSVWEF